MEEFTDTLPIVCNGFKMNTKNPERIFTIDNKLKLSQVVCWLLRLSWFNESTWTHNSNYSKITIN